MSDEFLDWVESHRVLIFIVIGVAVLAAVLLVVRSSNLKKNAALEAQQASEEAARRELEERMSSAEPELPPEPEQPIGDYQSGIGGKGDNRVDPSAYVPPSETSAPVREEMANPPYVTVWDWSNVPSRGRDNSSFTGYMDKVDITKFSSKWGSSLTDDDYRSEVRHLVGMFQNEDDEVRGDLQSLGWLINGLDGLGANDCVRFTDLHVMKHCSKTHVAMLCMYNWYSAFGLKDVLVFFEDISGTLSTDDFKAGDIFTAVAYVHNIKLETVNKQTVVNVQYALYEGALDD